jgi:hypothetical protein
MSIRKLRAGRVPSVTRAQFVGERGTIFWDEGSGVLYLSDGVTPGGSEINNPAFAVTSIGEPANPFEGELWYNPTTKELWAYHQGAFRGTINPATTTELGGIKAGPGVVIAPDGSLSLDSTGIPFNFGDFYAFVNTGPHDGACLSSINVNQDVNIVSNGSGSVNVVGIFNIHTTDANVEGALSAPPVFTVLGNGITKIHTPAPPLGTSVLAISANVSEALIPLAPGAMGAVLQLAGANDSSTTVGMDTFANNATASSNFTFRRYRGTLDTPLAVQAGDLMSALGATAFDGTGTATLPDQVTSIRYVAAENQTLTAKGSRIDMYAIPLGTISRTLNLSLDGVKVSVPLATQSTSTTTGALVTAGGLGVVKDVYVGGTIHGALTGNVTGNADTVTNGVYTSGSYSDPSWLTISKTKVGLSNVENTALSTSTYYIGTTQNTYGRASGAQTLSGVSISGNAGSVTNGVYTTDTGTVTNTMLAGSIANNKLVNTTIQVNGVTLTLGDTAKTITAAAGTLTGTTLNSTVVSSSLTSVGTLGSLAVTGTITAGLFSGLNYRAARDAGTIADNGTVTIDFSTDDVVLFVWANGVNIAYQNYTAGRIVKVIARKASGSGTDSLSLGGITAVNTSSGVASFAGNQDQTYFIELTCTNTTIGSVYAKF